MVLKVILFIYCRLKTGTTLTDSSTKSRKKKLTLLEAESSCGGSSIPVSMGSTSVLTQVWEEKQRISLSRERKAARVLGIVMGKWSSCLLSWMVLISKSHWFSYTGFLVLSFLIRFVCVQSCRGTWSSIYSLSCFICYFGRDFSCFSWASGYP